MLVLVNTDNHIASSAELTRDAEAAIRHALERFGEQVTRVEAFFTDEDSSERSTERDKRCLIEVRLAGLKPIAAGERGATVDQALHAATETIEKTLDRMLGRLHDAKGRGDRAA